MSINTQLSSFCADKPDNPAFWAALNRERAALCRELVKDGACSEIVDRMSNCASHACNLAACPVCMARADKVMFGSMQNMCEGTGETVFVASPIKYGRSKPNVADWPGELKGFLKRIGENEIDVDSYVGRFFCLPIFEGLGADMKGNSYYTGFAGTLRMTNFTIESEDDRLDAEDMLPVSQAEKVDAETDYYQDEYYMFFDHNVMPWCERCERKIWKNQRAQVAITAGKIELAKELGLKTCDYPLLRRLAYH